MILKAYISFFVLIILVGCGNTEIGNDEGSEQSATLGVTEVNYSEKFMSEAYCSQVIDNEFMLICYDYDKKVAKAVSYTLEGDLVDELNIEERPSFHIEQAIDSEYRAKTTDYTSSGYDRGHMAPDAAFDWSQESLDATYSLANVIPQVPTVNRYEWSKLERYVREKAVEIGTLNVVNVVNYTDDFSTIGDNNVAISLGYYKILYNQDNTFEECFYYENDSNSTLGDEVEAHKVNCRDIV